jgi:hypothetical protein
VTVEEFEFVVLNAKRAGVSRSSGRPSVIGRTEADRLTCSVYEVIDCYPVTAYECASHIM